MKELVSNFNGFFKQESEDFAAKAMTCFCSHQKKCFESSMLVVPSN